MERETGSGGFVAGRRGGKYRVALVNLLVEGVSGRLTGNRLQSKSR